MKKFGKGLKWVKWILTIESILHIAHYGCESPCNPVKSNETCGFRNVSGVSSVRTFIGLYFENLVLIKIILEEFIYI